MPHPPDDTCAYTSSNASGPSLVQAVPPAAECVYIYILFVEAALTSRPRCRCLSCHSNVRVPCVRQDEPLFIRLTSGNTRVSDSRGFTFLLFFGHPGSVFRVCVGKKVFFKGSDRFGRESQTLDCSPRNTGRARVKNEERKYINQYSLKKKKKK